MIRFRSERGVTLIEALIACTLLAIASFFVLRQFSGIQSQQSNLAQKLRIRQLIEAELSKVKVMAAFFPPLVDREGSTLSYVRCFSRTGAPSPNTAGGSNYRPTRVPSPPPAPSGICSGAEMEIQISPDPQRPGSASIEGLVLLGGSQPKFHYHVPVRFAPSL